MICTSSADYYLGFVEDEYVFSEATAQHIIPIRPAAGNMTEQMFIMHVIQNGTLSFGCKFGIACRTSLCLNNGCMSLLQLIVTSFRDKNSDLDFPWMRTVL